MTLSVFVDTNIPIYASGTEHPLREASLNIQRFIVDNEDSFVTDAEVLQEILHRYLAIRRWAEGSRTLRIFSEIMLGRIEPMLAVDVEVAGALAQSLRTLSARDLIHLAVMRRLGVTRIVSSDQRFDGVPGIERLDPARFEEWWESVIS